MSWIMLIIRKKDNRISLSIVYLTTIILGIIAILLSYFIIKMVSTFTDLIVFIFDQMTQTESWIDIYTKNSNFTWSFETKILFLIYSFFEYLVLEFIKFLILIFFLIKISAPFLLKIWIFKNYRSNLTIRNFLTLNNLLINSSGIQFEDIFRLLRPSQTRDARSRRWLRI